MNEAARYELGVSDGDLEFDTRAQLRELAATMAEQTTRSLDLATRHLDPELYDNERFAEAVRQLAIRSRYSRIRILVADPAPVARHGHRLLTLATQLPTFIAVHKTGQEHREFNEAWLIADNTGYLRRLFADRYEGTGTFCDRRQARDLTRRFDELWAHSETDPNLRRLSL